MPRKNMPSRPKFLRTVISRIMRIGKPYPTVIKNRKKPGLKKTEIGAFVVNNSVKNDDNKSRVIIGFQFFKIVCFKIFFILY